MGLTNQNQVKKERESERVHNWVIVLEVNENVRVYGILCLENATLLGINRQQYTHTYTRMCKHTQW